MEGNVPMTQPQLETVRSLGSDYHAVQYLPILGGGDSILMRRRAGLTSAGAVYSYIWVHPDGGIEGRGMAVEPRLA
jgi:hypothetical protein